MINKRKKSRWLNSLLFIGLVMTCSSLSASGDCVQFRVVGICIWIWPYPFDIEVTIKYGHFNPDVNVTVERAGLILSQDVPTYAAEDPRRIDTENRNHDNLMYKEAMATGNPLAGEIYCPSHSETTIYFKSEADIPSWKWGGLDTLTTAAWIPGVRDIGPSSLSLMGLLTGEWSGNGIYPRTGWTIQHSDPKGAGIVAHRVGDIVTRDGEPHIYNRDLGSGDAIFVEDEIFTWAPEGLIENTNEEGWFQPILPELDHECDVIGEAGSDDHISEDGEYSWILWRPYLCCDVEPGFLIDIPFMPYPEPSY